jgi:hypothetical protein
MCSDGDDLMPQHSGHEVMPYAEAFDVSIPQVHAGIYWCDTCGVEVTLHKTPARTL